MSAVHANRDFVRFADTNRTEWRFAETTEIKAILPFLQRVGDQSDDVDLAGIEAAARAITVSQLAGMALQ
jgi:hypothetical protein